MDSLEFDPRLLDQLQSRMDAAVSSPEDLALAHRFAGHLLEKAGKTVQRSFAEEMEKYNMERRRLAFG